MQFQDVWLEVRPCKGPSPEIELKTVLLIPSLSEAMKVGERTGADVEMKGREQMWDYSCRLGASEVADIMEVFSGAARMEDGRSVTYSTDVTYNGRCYTLTLFAYKSE